MATLAAQNANVTTGRTLTLSAAAGGGDRAPVGDGLFLLIRNGSGSSMTVTLDVTGVAFNAGPIPDTPVVVAAGAEVIVPLLRAYRSESDGLAGISYSLATSVTVAVVQV